MLSNFTDEENLFHGQDLFHLLIISLFLVTFMIDLVVYYEKKCILYITGKSPVVHTIYRNHPGENVLHKLKL